jgi:GTP-binding protein
MTGDAADKAHKLFAQDCAFVIAATEPKLFPEGQVPEVAFAGRSNVGKSSLLNALVGRRNLARASQTPGRTQSIVFFDLARRLMLVDLPGYGHAQASRADRAAWNELVQHYLQTRPNLRCVCLLIDSRHGALANDVETMRFLDRAAVSYKIVLTKSDQLRATDTNTRQGQVEALLARHPAARPGVIMTSADKARGIAELREFLADFALGKA